MNNKRFFILKFYKFYKNLVFIKIKIKNKISLEVFKLYKNIAEIWLN